METRQLRAFHVNEIHQPEAAFATPTSGKARYSAIEHAGNDAPAGLELSYQPFRKLFRRAIDELHAATIESMYEPAAPADGDKE